MKFAPILITAIQVTFIAACAAIAIHLIHDQTVDTIVAIGAGIWCIGLLFIGLVFANEFRKF